MSVVPRKESRPERFGLGDELAMSWSVKEDKDNIANCLADAFRIKKELELFRLVNHGRSVPDDEVPGKNEHLFLLQIFGFYGYVDMLLGVPEAVGTRPE
ncbi:hypothetical protein MVEG_10836 [Podila verticillata NRRL 6337]|nr:hypothetical protein MVEG_10836 [Podila verticillata NRRL 6337]